MNIIRDNHVKDHFEKTEPISNLRETTFLVILTFDHFHAVISSIRSQVAIVNKDPTASMIQRFTLHAGL